jgi:hypothetical protein
VPTHHIDAFKANAERDLIIHLQKPACRHVASSSSELKLLF